jgi:SOS-response transcriptional repressor LexA
MISPLGYGLSFQQNSYIIVDPNKTPLHGKFVVTASVNKSEAILRQYIEEGGTIYLKPLNPQYPLMQFDRTTKLLGVVIANITLM